MIVLDENSNDKSSDKDLNYKKSNLKLIDSFDPHFIVN